ncbi:hypothetical protein DPMN_123621 [Dreissena polymorpha]|uniref:Uncharacterized protein n=1 Tax=Dreissena polymorpha TaxID=45954 RepID=A0A9D4JVC8_DREPO|nr:hypothetical protein DPMN_123621 [Dreissena polymorpha]
MVLNEYPFAIWIDTSIGFKQVNISQLFEDARQMDIIGVDGKTAISRRTLPRTFYHFDEQPCTFINLTEIQSGFIIARATPFVVENILKPWVACALLLDCMVPRDGYLPYRNCDEKGEVHEVYGECHKFDESVWGILLHRAYGDDISKHMLTYGGRYIYPIGL